MAGYSFVGHGESQGINVNYIDAKGGIFAGLQLQYALSRHFALNLGFTDQFEKKENGFRPGTNETEVTIVLITIEWPSA